MAAPRQPGPGSNGAVQKILRDPGIAHGPFKVLPYSPGGFVVFDTRAAMGEGTVGKPYTGDDAKARAEVACKAAAAALEGAAAPASPCRCGALVPAEAFAAHVAACPALAKALEEPAPNGPADVGFKA